MQGQWVENARPVWLLAPQNITGTAVASAYFGLKFGARAHIAIITGAWAGGTSAVTLNQATTQAGSTNVALAFTTYWTGTSTVDVLVRNTATNNTFSLSAANTLYLIEINNYDLVLNSNTQAPTDAYINVALGSPSSNADYIAALAYVYDGQYAGKASIMPSLFA